MLFLFGLFEGSRQAERDFLHCASNELLGGAGNIPGQIQFLGEDVGSSAGKKGERYAVAVLVGCQAVDDFIERAVTAAGADKAAAFVSGAGFGFCGIAPAGGFGKFGFEPARDTRVTLSI